MNTKNAKLFEFSFCLVFYQHGERTFFSFIPIDSNGTKYLKNKMKIDWREKTNKWKKNSSIRDLIAQDTDSGALSLRITLLGRAVLKMTAYNTVCLALIRFSRQLEWVFFRRSVIVLLVCCSRYVINPALKYDETTISTRTDKTWVSVEIRLDRIRIENNFK